MSRLALFLFSLGLAAAAPQPAWDSDGFPTGARRIPDGFPTAYRREGRAIGSGIEENKIYEVLQLQSDAHSRGAFRDPIHDWLRRPMGFKMCEIFSKVDA